MTVERVYAPVAYEWHRPELVDGKCALCDARTNRIHRRLVLGTEESRLGEGYSILIGPEERAYINSSLDRAQVPPPPDAHPTLRKLQAVAIVWRERASRHLQATGNDRAPGAAQLLNGCAEDLERLLVSEAFDDLAGPSAKAPPEPIPIILTCIACGARHIDEGEFATKPHESHACQKCGVVWKPAKVPTVGVQFLPGYRNEPSNA